MASPDDDMRQEAGPPDGRPRRQPPIIDVKAVEVSPDGPSATSTRWDPLDVARFLKRILASLSSTILAFLSFRRSTVIGSVCGAGLIAGALWIYLPLEGIDGPPQNTRDTTGPDGAIERTKDEAALKGPPAQVSSDTDLANRVAALEAMLAPLADRITELERSFRDNAAEARTAVERANKVADLIEEAKKSGNEQNSPQQLERRTFDSLADRLKIIESSVASLHRKQDLLDRAASASAALPDKPVRAAVAAAALRSAVERGASFTVELAAARSLHLDERALASLESFAATGVPTQDQFLHDLSALMPELLRASVPAGRDLGYLDRLQASAAKMLNIRPVRDEPGDDPTTVIGRIEFKIARQDIVGVVAELDKLPSPAREIAQSWRTKVLARQDAVESARRIATASLGELGVLAAPGPTPQ
ncbi:MAG TPA: hypothetical protein VKP67_29330 [Xanthobacteraceae bacterium]|nr:hypothetical protein [Xanthobacteraceae bacterium]